MTTEPNLKLELEIQGMRTEIDKLLHARKLLSKFVSVYESNKRLDPAWVGVWVDSAKQVLATIDEVVEDGEHILQDLALVISKAAGNVENETYLDVVVCLARNFIGERDVLKAENQHLKTQLKEALTALDKIIDMGRESETFRQRAWPRLMEGKGDK